MIVASMTNIALMQEYDTYCAGTREDTQDFIVLACNAHDALVEAMSNAAAALESLLAHYANEMPTGDKTQREQVLQQARAALAKAEGGAE
jgi:hypothetical protein